MKDFRELIMEKEQGGSAGFKLDPALLSDREKLKRRCRERCLYLITGSQKTESRLREKLKLSGRYDDEIIDETMEFLKSYGYLDDRGLALRLIKEYSESKSLREIEQKLYQRGVSREDIQAAVQEYREQEDSCDRELSAARRVIFRKHGDRELDEGQKREMFAALVRKGFSYSVTKRVLSVDEDY